MVQAYCPGYMGLQGSVAKILQNPSTESLQQECSKPAQNVMIELYCCGPGTTLPNKEGSWVLGLQGSVAKIQRILGWLRESEQGVKVYTSSF